MRKLRIILAFIAGLFLALMVLITPLTVISNEEVEGNLAESTEKYKRHEVILNNRGQENTEPSETKTQSIIVEEEIGTVEAAGDIVAIHRSYLQQKSVELGLPFDLLDKIIECESGWKMVKNPYSSSFGYFQIIDGTEKTTPQYAEGLRKYDPYVNLDMGIFLYQTRGSQPWYPSEYCWG